MELRILAVGRIGKGPEAELVDDYLKRAERLARGAGLSKIGVTEIDDRKFRETSSQQRAIADAVVGENYWALDERGETLTSPKFSKALIGASAQGLRRLNIVIGGADGLNEELRSGASTLLSFGKMVWPHMLVRVMLSEQIYRALAINGNLPYHRE